ncbi:MAG: hypothetical protein LIP11_00975 [Clostridiales bacterium]|nr:hypothetical protein [Clostridiales bacterium]
MRTEDEKTDGIKNTGETPKTDRHQKTDKKQTKSKVTPFRYPYRESDDPVIDAFILQGLQEEAEEAETRVNSDPELSQINPPDDQYDKIVARLKAMGVWEEDEEEEQQTEEAHKKEVEEARKEIAAANRKKEMGDGENWLESESGLADGVERMENEDELADGTEKTENEDEVAAGVRMVKDESEFAADEEMMESENGFAGGVRRCGIEASERSCHEDAASKEGTSDAAVSGEEEIYRMLSERDREAIALGRRAQARREKRSRCMRMIVKRGGIVAAAFVLLIGVSMNVSASRQWIVQMWGAVTEVFVSRTVTENVEETRAIESTVAESLAAMEEIEKITGIPGLNFVYWPEGMEYLDYEVLDEDFEAHVFYLYEEHIAELYMKNIDFEETNYYVSDGNSELIETFDIQVGIEVEIWRTDLNENLEKYRAEFAYEDYRYIFVGYFSFDEFRETVKNINFLSDSL